MGRIQNIEYFDMLHFIFGYIYYLNTPGTEWPGEIDRLWCQILFQIII